MATFYWVTGGNGLWSSSSNWSSSTGGSGGYGVPGTSDDVVLDANSPNITLDANVEVKTLTATNYTSVSRIRSFTFASYSLTLNGSGAVLDTNFYTVIIFTTGYNPTIYLTNPTSTATSFKCYSLGWVANAVGDTVSKGINLVIASGNYALTGEGYLGSLDFTGTFSGSLTSFNGIGIYDTFTAGSSMSFSSGGQFFFLGSDAKIRSNGVSVAFYCDLQSYYQGKPKVTLLDALTCLNFTVSDQGIIDMSGKNLTVSAATSMYFYNGGQIIFGSGNPTLTFSGNVNFMNGVFFTGQGTATIAFNGATRTITCSPAATTTIPATINQASSSQLTLSGGAYLNIRNTAYGTVRFTGPIRFVDFSLKGTAGTPLTVQGTASSTAVSKVDPWYVGPNSTDGGGNTNIIFSGNEGSDYLTVSNLSGSYNYGPHFLMTA